MPSTPDLTVVTPTIPGRACLLADCRASVQALGLPHLISLDLAGDGPAATRNRLIDQVGTEWVLFLDDDDLLLPNYLDTVGPHLSGADVVYTAWELMGAEEPAPLPVFDANLLAWRNFIPVTACVRTTSLRAVGGFPDESLEDWALWRRLLAAGARFTYTPETAWVYRRQHSGRNTAPLLPDEEDTPMPMVTNDQPVFGPDGTKVMDAGSKVEDSHEIVQRYPDQFRPLGTAVDEGTGRTSAVAADPELLHPDAPEGDARSGGGEDPVSTPMGGPTPHRVRDTSATPPAKPADATSKPTDAAQATPKTQPK